MTANQILDDVRAAETEALASVDAAADTAALAAIEPSLFGKSSVFGRLKSGLGGLDPEDRKVVGRALNESRTRVTDRLSARRDELVAVERRAQLETERMDLTEVTGTLPVGHRHLLSQTHGRLEDVFVGMGFTIAEGPEVETDWMNFEALNFGADHPARDMQDTLYVDWGKPESTLLRTHTSPVQMRTMLAQEPPIYVVCPGRVYRRDTADATHMPVFHQIEGLVIDRNITFADLAGTLEEFTRAYFGADIETRLRPSYFPFTEPSAEYDITDPRSRTGWLELGGCGMVHPNVLRNGGIDPEEWSGFAFGFGTDRLAMMRHGITMLRELWANDVRFLRQF